MKIKVFKSEKLLKEFNVTRDSFVLGRVESCDICVPDENISRKHIEFNVVDENKLSFIKKAKFAMITKNGEDLENGYLENGESLEIGNIRLLLETGNKKIEDFDFFTMSSEPEKLEPKQEAEQEVEQEESSKEESGQEEPKEASVKEVALEQPVKQDISDATVVGPSRLLYQLIAISGPHKDKVFTLDKDIIIAGRGKKTDIPLIDDLVSREHARFYRQGVDYYVVDLDSANGTRVNGKKNNVAVLLTSGDIVEIGSTILRFMVVNPHVQNVSGIKDIEQNISNKKEVIEKIVRVPGDTEIRKIERSFSVQKRKPLLIIVLGLALVLLGFIYFLAEDKPEPEPKKQEPVVEKQVTMEEAVPEIVCEEQGSYCEQPLDVQKQLSAEYEVGIKLLKNFQFELAEDRAYQILAKVPDWIKAKDLLDVARAEKEKLLAKKKEEEDASIRKELEKKVAEYIQKAETLMRQEKYEEVKSIISDIFSIDPNNAKAKEFADKISEIEARRKRLEEERKKYLVTVSMYENTLNEAKRLYSDKQYRKSIEVFQKCLSLPVSSAERVKEIRASCSSMLANAQKSLKEAITPELSAGVEAYTSERYKEAINSYNRVLKMDYKSKEAKDGIAKAKDALEQKMRSVYANASVAESVSDYPNACMMYHLILEEAVPGSKYYNMAADKAKKRCGTRL